MEAVARKANYASNGSLFNVKNVYIDIPLLFKYNPWSEFWIEAGPQFNALVSEKSVLPNQNAFKPSDLSGVIGFEARLPINLRCDIRYAWGFTDVNNKKVPGENGAWKTSSFQLSLLFRILSN